MICDNLANIEERIQAACDRSGRKRSEITLIAVSKTKPTSIMKSAYDSGIRHFGENRVQEMVNKYNEIDGDWGDNINWHLIGHLQRNKVKYIVDKVDLIHSVDSVRLAKQIEKEAAKKDLICDILIQINIAKEDTKYGIDKKDLESFFQEIIAFPHIRVRGLMAIAPYVEKAEDNREFFKQMRELFIDIKTKKHDNYIYKDHMDSFNILSMGMTGDFEIAVEEGATMLRIGTGVFGDRQ